MRRPVTLTLVGGGIAIAAIATALWFYLRNDVLLKSIGNEQRSYLTDYKKQTKQGSVFDLCHMSVVFCSSAERAETERQNREIRKRESTVTWDFSKTWPPYSDVACNGIQNSYECAKAIERERIKIFAELVSRDGEVIKLRLGDGSFLEIRDTDPESSPDAGKRHSFFDYIGSIGYYLLHEQPYEGSNFLLVRQKTGEKQEVANLPIVSPDRRRFIAARFCDAYCDPGIAIWRIEGKGIVREAWLTSGDFAQQAYWADASVAWGADTIINVVGHSMDYNNRVATSSTYSIELVAGEWRVTAREQ